MLKFKYYTHNNLVIMQNIYTFVRVFFMVLDLRFVRAVVRHPSLFYFYHLFLRGLKPRVR